MKFHDKLRAKNVICLMIMLLSLTISFRISAQANYTVIGLVRDNETLESISFANVKTIWSGTSTNKNGVFVIKTALSDSLLVSHINYEPFSIPLRMNEDTLFIFLNPKVTLLNEVKVYGLPSEEQLKYNILHTKVKIPTETSNAIKNFELARRIYLSGYVPVLDDKGNFKHYITPPKGVSILGLIEVIKNRGNEENPWSIRRNEINSAADSLFIKFYNYKNPFK